jgi:hypothetical protein
MRTENSKTLVRWQQAEDNSPYLIDKTMTCMHIQKLSIKCSSPDSSLGVTGVFNIHLRHCLKVKSTGPVSRLAFRGRWLLCWPNMRLISCCNGILSCQANWLPRINILMLPNVRISSTSTSTKPDALDIPLNQPDDLSGWSLWIS